jgi:hypothetical protein
MDARCDEKEFLDSTACCVCVPIAAVCPYLNNRLKESAHLASPSARVVYAALAGDLAVASAKFGAAALSGSSAGSSMGRRFAIGWAAR